MTKGTGGMALVGVTAERHAAAKSRDTFDFRAHLQRQREWSGRTFGPGPRTHGVIDHIRKELHEIEAAPTDISEWIDVVILALDGAWRSGASPDEIITALVTKQAKNEARSWPDWRTASPDHAIEHHRADLTTARAESQTVRDEVIRAELDAARDELERMLAELETMRVQLDAARAVADRVIDIHRYQALHGVTSGAALAQAWRIAVNSSIGLDQDVRHYQAVIATVAVPDE
jgi:hypothetical protein